MTIIWAVIKITSHTYKAHRNCRHQPHLIIIISGSVPVMVLLIAIAIARIDIMTI